MKWFERTFLAAALLCLAASAAQAAPIDLTTHLSGNTSYDGWADMTASNYPGYGTFPGGSLWPNPIGSNQDSGGFNAAVLDRVAGNGVGGGPFPSTSSIYFGSFGSGEMGGTLSVSDTTPVANLENVVLQLELASGFSNDVFPVLSYNNGVQQLADSTPLLVDQGQIAVPGAGGGGTSGVDTWLLQWDLSSIVDPITAFEVVWSQPQHGALLALQLDQSDLFSPIAGTATAGVPEPGTLVLLSFGAVLLMAVAARRRRSEV